jgi:hypothetical protein
LEVNPPEWPASLYLVAGHFVGQVLKSKIVTKRDEAWEAVLAQEPSQMLAGQISKVSRMNASDCRAEVLTTRDGAKHHLFRYFLDRRIRMAAREREG